MNKLVRPIGIHVRIHTTFEDLLHKVKALGITCFQCFFIVEPTGAPLKLTQEEKNKSKALLSKLGSTPFLHGSYWINIARPSTNGHAILQREIKLANELGFNSIVVHPGSAKGGKTKEQAIDQVACALNSVLDAHKNIIILLENAAHGGMTVGSDITDFKLLQKKLKYPERVKYCIDTAHACAYGYNLTDKQEQDNFIALLDDAIGIDNIVLIHLNDTKRACGSKIDEHLPPGEGIIGKSALQRFVLHPKLKHIPLILELPSSREADQQTIVEEVKQWHS